MKKIVLIFLISSPFLLYSQNNNGRYPDLFYFNDIEHGYNILLGSIFSFLNDEYGPPNEEVVLTEYTSPPYQLKKVVYDEFSIVYNTYDFRVDQIEINSDSFVTSKGIRIGSKAEDVILAYGNGYIQDSNASELIGDDLIYRFFLQEINIRGEKTYLDFTIEDGIVTQITFRIESTI